VTGCRDREPLPVLLCSASPRRAALLESAGVRFERGPAPGVDETPPPGLPPEAAAEAIAVRKAAAAARAAPGRLVLAADTVVALGARVLGKPADATEAAAMLRMLSGRDHVVATGVALARDGTVRSARAEATVRFRPLSEAEVAAYAAGGEGLDKAGGYALQGGAAAFASVVEGDADTVVGLPVRLVSALLESFPSSGR
jgi:septum formation protein